MFAVLVDLLNPTSGDSGGIDMVPVIIGSGSTIAAITAAWLAFRGKKINPLENGISFVATEAQNIAEFHREDAIRARASEEEMRVSLEAARALIIVMQTPTPPETSH